MSEVDDFLEKENVAEATLETDRIPFSKNTEKIIHTQHSTANCEVSL